MLVEIKAIEIYHVEVDADSEEEAIEIANDRLFSMHPNNRSEFHNDSDSESMVIG